MRNETELKEIVHEELDKILANKAFRSSRILSRFLSFVVAETLGGREQQLKEYTIGKEVLGKPGVFMPQLDASVRIHAIRLRKYLDEYYKSTGKKSLLRIELPKGSYRPIFIEQQPGGNYLADIAHIKALPDGKHLPEDHICIIPFSSLVNNDSTNFSSIGFCEFLSEKLSLFQDISVVSFQSICQFLESGGNAHRLGKEFGLSYYLTGSIEFEKEKIFISVQLIDARSNILIWSHNFDEGLGENTVMDIADGIANKIVASLAGYSGYLHFRMFVDKGHAHVMSKKVALAVLWFYRYQAHHSESVFYDAVRNLETAVNEDPNCALCWAVLAHLYADSIIYNYANVADPLQRAQDCLSKSLALNPDGQHASLVQGWIYILLRNKPGVIDSVTKTVSLNPNSSFFLATCSLGMSLVGEYEKSFLLWEKAIKLSPLPYWWLNLPRFFIALKKHNYSQALFYARKTGTPKVIYEHVFEMIALYYLGETVQIISLLSIYKQKYPQGIDFVSNALPMILFDEELTSLITLALTNIRQTYLNNTDN